MRQGWRIVLWWGIVLVASAHARADEPDAHQPRPDTWAHRKHVRSDIFKRDHVANGGDQFSGAHVVE